MRQEIIRKAIHLSFSAFVPLAYLFLNVTKIWMVILLGIVAITIIIIDLRRSHNTFLSKIFGIFFNGMLRSHELAGKLTGASYVFIGSFISVLIFPKEIAILALLFTAIGDTIAALYGRKFGKLRIWNKTIEGSLAGLIACIIIGLFFPNIPNIIKFNGAFAAMFIELLPIKIDDNLRIPLFSGIVMYGLSIL